MRAAWATFRTTTKQPKLEPKVAASLERVVEYLFWDEIRDWEERGRPRNHIYREVRRIDAWLSRMKARAQ